MSCPCSLAAAKALEGTLAKQVTQPGQLIGDVPYMSPERTREQTDVDHRSDIYGLGATLYALLTGRPPFEGNSLPELIRQVRQAEPVKPKFLGGAELDEPELPKDFQEPKLKDKEVPPKPLFSRREKPSNGSRPRKTRIWRKRP